MRRLVPILVLSLLVFWGACHWGFPPKRPNIILICIDATRADRLGRFDGSAAVTPHLDELAAEAVVFDQAIAAASWTKPSVPSLLTGLYPSQHGVFDTGSAGVDVLPAEVETMAEILSGAGYDTSAFVENVNLQKRYSHLDQGFAVYEEDVGDAAAVVDRFLDWLEERETGPFFTYLHILDPHLPYTPTTPLPGQDLSDNDRLRSVEWDMRGSRWGLLREAVKRGHVTVSVEELAALQRMYDSEIHAVDGTLGRLFELLRTRGLFEDSLIVVTADHGEGFFEHGRLDHGYGLYDELLRIPLLMRFPRSRFAGRRIAAQVGQVDVAPTLLDVVGLSSTQAAGVSLLPLLENPGGIAERAALSEEKHGVSTSTALRTHDYKYIRTESAQVARIISRPQAPMDLRPGVRVQAEGIFTSATLVTDDVKKIAAGDTDCELNAPVSSVDPRGQWLEILGHHVAIDIDSVKLVPRDAERTLADLVPARWVRVHISGASGAWKAHRLEKLPRVPGYELEVEGVVEGVASDARGALWIDICGMRALVGKEVAWKQFEQAPRPVGEPVGEPERGERVVEELYDLGVDAGESNNIVALKPEIVAEMRAKLVSVRRGLVSPGDWQRQTVDLDHRTRERLKSLGYVE